MITKEDLKVESRYSKPIKKQESELEKSKVPCFGDAFVEAVMSADGTKRSDKWNVITDSSYVQQLPKQDCLLWVTRVTCFGPRFVQTIKYYSGTDIEWDGVLAWQVKVDGYPEPSPCESRHYALTQHCRGDF